MPVRERLSREDQKEQRRQALVQAAEALIRETGSTEFSMLMLAQRAGLSPTTPYNLFGTKSAILYALLNNSADRMFHTTRRDHAEGDPFRRVLRAGDSVAATLVGDPVFFRPLYAFLFGVPDAVYRPAFMARTQRYWESALEGLVRGRRLPAGMQVHQLARLFVIQAIGAVDMWVQQELHEAQLAAQLRHGSCLLLLGLAPASARAALRAEMAAAAARLPNKPPAVPKEGAL